MGGDRFQSLAIYPNWVDPWPLCGVHHDDGYPVWILCGKRMRCKQILHIVQSRLERSYHCSEHSPRDPGCKSTFRPVPVEHGGRVLHLPDHLSSGESHACHVQPTAPWQRFSNAQYSRSSRCRIHLPRYRVFDHPGGHPEPCIGWERKERRQHSAIRWWPRDRRDQHTAITQGQPKIPGDSRSRRGGVKHDFITPRTLANVRCSRAIPASALDEDFDDEDDEISGEDRDDEKTITRYNVCD